MEVQDQASSMFRKLAGSGHPTMRELREERKRKIISRSRAGMRWQRKNAFAGEKEQLKRAAAEVELSTGSWPAKSGAPGRGCAEERSMWVPFGYLSGVKLKP